MAVPFAPITVPPAVVKNAPSPRARGLIERRATPYSTAADDAGSADTARLPMATAVSSASWMSVSSASANVACACGPVHTWSPA
jgi:hypothetical protein